MRQAKKPETEERQNASMPPSKWTCPRERTPATANTSYAVPQRRSRRRLAGSPEASPHRAAEPAPPTTLPKVINKGAAPRPPRPWHQHEADPGAKKQKYAQNCNFFAIANCREASKRGLTPGKAANRTHSGPFPPRGGRKGVRNRKKVAQKSEFLFLRNGSSQRSNSCERQVCLQCQSGRAAARNHSASTIQALMPSPLAKIPR